MDAPARQFCPLCRSGLCMPDAVRTHLVADHKRSAAEADELIDRFDTAQPIPEQAPAPHMYCATAKLGSGVRRRAHESLTAPELQVN
jgi:hypothetical protein